MMKNKFTLIITLWILTLASLNLWSQETQLTKRHEFSLNATSTLDGSPEISYHYLLNDESALGVAVRVAADKNEEYRFLVSPNYRIFFGNKPAAGFFVEGNMAIFSQYEQMLSFIGTVNANEQSNFGFGFGLALGGKFITKNGWTAELFGGAGRNLIASDVIDDFYPRFGVSIGKRF